MARVPVITETRARLAPIQGGYRQPVNDVGAFGGRTAAALTQVGQQLSVLAADQQIRHDEASVKNADTEYSTKLEELRNRVMQLRGSNAINDAAKVNEDMRKARSEIESKLQNDRQRGLFKRAADARSLSITRVINNHVNNQRQVFENDASLKRIENQKREAANNFADAKAAGVSIAVGRAEVFELAKRNGWSPERLKFELANYDSEAHANVIAARISAKDTAGAKVWLDQYGGKLTPVVRARIKAALSESSLRERAQAKADAIMSQTALTEKQKEQKALAIKDAQLRDETTRRVRSRIDRNRQLTLRQQADIDNRVIGRLLNGEITDRDQIDANDWAGMSNRGKNAVISTLKRGLRPDSDPTTWSNLFFMKDADFKNVNLQLFIDKLSKRDLESFMRRQNKLKVSPVDTKFDTQTLPQQIKNALDEVGISNKGDRAKYARVVSEKIAATQKAKNRKLDQDERKLVIDRMLLDVNWTWSRDQKLFEVIGTRDESEAFRRVEVPNEEREKIIQALKRAKLESTNEAIRLMYLRSLGIPRDTLRKHFPGLDKHLGQTKALRR